MKKKQWYKKAIIAYAVFSIIYQIVFVAAAYLLHDTSGETILYYIIPDIYQIEAMGIGQGFAVLFYIMIIIAFFWPVVILGVIQRTIVPKHGRRLLSVTVQIILLVLLAVFLYIALKVLAYHGLKAFLVGEILILYSWLDTFLIYKIYCR